MKKVLVVAAVLVLLGGGGWWAFEQRGRSHSGARGPSGLPRAGRQRPRRARARIPRTSRVPRSRPAGPAAKVPDRAAPPRRVRGRVVGEDGTPIAGARLWEVGGYRTDVVRTVTAAPAVDLAKGETDAEGRFDLPITESWSNGLTCA